MNQLYVAKHQQWMTYKCVFYAVMATVSQILVPWQNKNVSLIYSSKNHLQSYTLKLFFALYGYLVECICASGRGAKHLKLNGSESFLSCLEINSFHQNFCCSKAQ